MKDTIKIIKKNAIALAKHTASACKELITIIAAIILIVLQLLAEPFKRMVQHEKKEKVVVDKVQRPKKSIFTAPVVDVEEVTFVGRTVTN